MWMRELIALGVFGLVVLLLAPVAFRAGKRIADFMGGEDQPSMGPPGPPGPPGPAAPPPEEKTGGTD